MSKVEEMFDEMLEVQCEQMAKDKELDKDDDTDKKETTKGLLKKFLAYIKSIRFTRKCKDVSKKYDLNYKIVKNHYIASILGKIADVLHLGITITAEIVTYAVEFISAIINKITYFCCDVCIKITSLLTLNCGSYLRLEGEI